MAFTTSVSVVIGSSSGRFTSNNVCARPNRIAHKTVIPLFPIVASATSEAGVKKESTSPLEFGWPDHTMNINYALMKESEGKRFSEIMEADVSILQGIGEKSKEILDNLKVNTVKELANYKYFKIARAIVALAGAEEVGARDASSVMNLDQAVDVDYEKKSLTEIIDAPVSALQGLSKGAADLFAQLNVKTVADLASFKYCVWAESIVTLAAFEHKKSAAERKQEKILKE